MKVIDPGHKYQLNHLDGINTSILTFVKRIGENYPGNENPHEGTNIQEVLRVLISRCKYLNKQIYSPHTEEVIYLLRLALFSLECRNAERKGRTFLRSVDDNIELLPTCQICGHIDCKEHF